MKSITRASTALPDDHVLTEVLATLFGALTRVQRATHVHASTFPAEIVTCETATGRRLRLLCKYSDGLERDDHGHRGGLRYELEVYRRILQGCECTVPTLHGAHEGRDTVWLILGYLDGAVTVNKVPERIEDAARWIGRFHAQTHASPTVRSFLITYDAAFYMGWIRRACSNAAAFYEMFPWMKDACERFQPIVAHLAAQPPTIIHGEFCPANVLVHDGQVFPVDWESAAWAPGEIDLAALTDGWTSDVAAGCAAAYSRSRWPSGAPSEHGRTLAAAKAYVHFRWLGDRPGWVTRKSRWRFEALQAIARQWSVS